MMSSSTGSHASAQTDNEDLRLEMRAATASLQTLQRGDEGGHLQAAGVSVQHTEVCLSVNGIHRCSSRVLYGRTVHVCSHERRRSQSQPAV